MPRLNARLATKPATAVNCSHGGSSGLGGWLGRHAQDVPIGNCDRRSWMPPRNTAWPSSTNAKAGYVAPAWHPATGRYQMGHRGTVRVRAGGARKILTCQTFQSDAGSSCSIGRRQRRCWSPVGGVVTLVELVSPSTAILRVDTSGALRYRAGQFAQLRSRYQRMAQLLLHIRPTAAVV